MQVLILGGGQVGSSIAQYLAADGHDVSIVDKSWEVLKRLSDNYDIKPFVGFASYPNVLEKAGAEGADLLLAVTSSDEVNILACQIASQMFETNLKIARIRSHAYLEKGNPFPNIDVIISPELSIANWIAGNLQISGIIDLIPVFDGSMKIICIRCQKNSEVSNTKVENIFTCIPKVDFSVLAIKRGNDCFIPIAEESILPFDEVFILTNADNLHDLLHGFGHQDSLGRQIVILGAGNIGLNLATQLEESNFKIILVEKDKERAEYAANFLNHGKILFGDSLEEEILLEAQVNNAQMVIALTNDEKTNLLAASISKTKGARQVIALASNLHNAKISQTLNIDVIINPKTITIASIVKHLKRGKTRSIYRLGDIAFIEAEANEYTKVLGMRIEELLELGLHAIIHEDSINLHPNRGIITAGDMLFFVGTTDNIHAIETLFSVKASYL